MGGAHPPKWVEQRLRCSLHPCFSLLRCCCPLVRLFTKLRCAWGCYWCTCCPCLLLSFVSSVLFCLCVAALSFVGCALRFGQRKQNGTIGDVGTLVVRRSRLPRAEQIVDGVIVADGAVGGVDLGGWPRTPLRQSRPRRCDASCKALTRCSGGSAPGFADWNSRRRLLALGICLFN